jgi:hypothetical protein
VKVIRDTLLSKIKRNMTTMRIKIYISIQCRYIYAIQLDGKDIRVETQTFVLFSLRVLLMQLHTYVGNGQEQRFVSVVDCQLLKQFLILLYLKIFHHCKIYQSL